MTIQIALLVGLAVNALLILASLWSDRAYRKTLARMQKQIADLLQMSEEQGENIRKLLPSIQLGPGPIIRHRKATDRSA